MRLPAIFLSIYFLLFTLTTSAQYYDTGQDPARLKWLQIKTGRFTVIYPEKYGAGGIDFARSLDEAYSKLTLFYPEKKIKIPVVIHNFTTQSNGYVVWAPKRMEIYPTPEQNTVPLDPNRQLAIHELTHVLQMESLSSGFSKVLSIAFGEQFPGVVAGLLLPLWYLEGDAVFTESVLTESGRGRTPEFQKQLKAIVVEKNKIYKYDKMINGSFRDFTPDHYKFGYQMIAWSLTKKDPRLWNKVLSFTANEPFTINPVNISLTENAGTTKRKLFDETFDTLRTLWQQDVIRSNALTYEPVNPPKRDRHVDYYSPVFTGSGTIAAIKTSLSDPPSFVLINPSEKSEKKIHNPGLMKPWLLSCAKGKLVWVETTTDPRWDNRNYSVIKLLDLASGRTRQITFRSRYLSASLSPDGKIIAASENSAENRNNLVLINSNDGNVIRSVPVPDNSYLQRPQWSEDGKKITFISLTAEGEGILSYSLANQKWEILFEACRDDLQSTFLRNDSLFFISSYSGTDNIYVLTAGNKISEITNSRFGANDLCISGGKVIFSDYSSSGNNICITTIKNADDIPKAPVSSSSFLINRFDTLSVPPYDNSSGGYVPEPFRKWQHLFRFHSWMPFYADIEEVKSDLTSVRPGFTLMSQNQLSTLITSVGYEYSEDKRHMLHSRITWKGLYPVLDSRFDYGYFPSIDTTNSMVSWIPSPLNPAFSFKNSLYIPLKFYSGKFTQNLYPSLSSDYVNKYVYLKENSDYDYGQVQITGRLYFSNYYRSAFRDIYPRWAQLFDLSYTYAPFDKLIYGSDVSLKTALYFPGFFKNNGIKFRYETEKQDFARYLMSNKIHYPRSYHSIISAKLDFLSVDYVTPLFYPDFNISSFFYMTRIRTGLFFDYAWGTDNYHLRYQDGRLVIDHRNPETETFSSFGVELLSDFYLFRIPYPVTAGAQFTWKSFGQAPAIEMLFNIDIYGWNIGRSRK
ncbi:MAG: hypothetical protein MUO72_10320 [Bacteroidales bacterium]|nr:hypothetical protein [Bacteroidales bacterium]